jgi:hypothetical protein
MCHQEQTGGAMVRRPRTRSEVKVLPLQTGLRECAPEDPKVSYWQTEHLEDDAFRVIRAAVCEVGQRPGWYRGSPYWGDLAPGDEEECQEDPVGPEHASILAYRVGTPGVSLIDDLVELDMTDALGDELIHELTTHPDVCKAITGERKLDDVVGDQFIVISKLEASTLRKHYGSVLVRRFLEHCPPAKAILIFAPGERKGSKTIPVTGSWAFLEAFGFERASEKTLLFSIPYDMWGLIDPRMIREMIEDSTQE